MNNILKNTGNKKPKANPLDQSDQIYILKNFQDQLLEGIVLRGVKNINKVILRKVKDNLVEKGGAFKKEDICLEDTQKLHWKKARHFWNISLIEKMKNAVY
jgi:DNA-directed RNA polymerase II subunit RPB1